MRTGQIGSPEIHQNSSANEAFQTREQRSFSIFQHTLFSTHHTSSHSMFMNTRFKLETTSGTATSTEGVDRSAGNEALNTETPSQLSELSASRSTFSDADMIGPPVMMKEDGMLNLPSGIQRYDEHTVSLFTTYLLAENGRKENAEFAGRLVFPHHEEGSKLFAESTLKALSATKQARLQSAVLFPDDPYAAQAFAKLHGGRGQLSLDELAGLYAGRKIPSNPGKARELATELGKSWKPFHEGKVDKEVLARALTELVREEIAGDDYSISAKIELARFFKQRPAMIEKILKDPLHGLSPEEQVQRDAKLARREEMEKYALPRLVIQGLRNLTTIEAELKRSGYVEELSSVDELAPLFSETEQNIRNYLRVCPQGNQYLESEERLAQQEKDKAYVVQSTKRAIDLHQQGDLDSLKSDTETADRLDMSPIGVFHCLREALSEDDWNYRSFILREQVAVDEHRRSVLSFVKSEIAALRQGDIHGLSTTQELAEIFRVSPTVIGQALSNPGTGLTTSDHEIRRFALSSQQPTDKLMDVLHLITVMSVKDALEKARSVEEIDVEEIEHSPSPYSGKLIVNGAPYDSMEEAVASACLTEFLSDFEIRPGLNHQVNIGRGRVDFIIDDCVVEYHPIKAFWSKDRGGDFKTREEYVRYIELRDSPGLSDARKRLFVDETKARLEQEYKQDRRALIDSDDSFRGKELIVATSKEEFFHSVVKRFAETPITLARFKKAWARNSRIVNRIRMRQDKEREAE